MMRLQKVVVGVDFSAPSLATLRWVARELAPDAELVIVHAIDLAAPPPFLADRVEAVYDRDREAWARAETQLADVELLTSLRGARRVIRVGRAHDVLCAVARDEGADLLAIGPHGERSPHSRLLGTTADRTVRLSTVPVLVGIDVPATGPARLVAAVDDSSITSSVLDWAGALAESTGAAVALVHVLSSAVVGTALSVAAAKAHGGEDTADQAREELRSETEHWLRAMAPPSLRPPRSEVIVADGHAAEEILAVARRLEADLVLLGRHGARHVLPALLGRTIRTVLHEARCPVLVVTPAPAAHG